ncbi:MAG: hypothetical protein WAT51_00310 [Holophaga sp.]
MIKPPKTSIFDITLAGTSAPEPEPTPAPAGQPDAFQTAKLPIPQAPKTSIFDITLAGVPDPVAPEAVPEKASLPLSPKTSIFDITQTGLPTGIPPAPVQAEVIPEPEPWDEGTAAEWNPKWNPKPAPLPKPEPVMPSGSRLRFALLAVGLVACVAVIAGGVLYFRTPATLQARSHPKPVPASLQGYLTQAEGGDSTAMRMLGLCYCYGIAAPADWPEGVLWLRRAAKAGNATARTELASMGVRLE